MFIARLLSGLSQFGFVLILVLSLLLTASQCGNPVHYPEPERVEVATPAQIRTLEDKTLKKITEHEHSQIIVDIETIPLYNCGGNSPLVIEEERSREVIYAITDEKGGSLGISHILIGELNQVYGSVDGKKETKSYKIRLETRPNTYVEYTIAWKETWLNAEATILEVSNRESLVPFRVKKALGFQIQSIRNIACE